jgi:DNA-3-methyladenine glycosylase
VISPAVERELARGPARLCQALGIDRGLDGADVCDLGSPLRIRSAPEAGPGRPVPDISRGPRVGISAAADRPWRFWLTGDPTVSPYRPHMPRARPKPVSSPATEDETMRR